MDGLSGSLGAPQVQVLDDSLGSGSGGFGANNKMLSSEWRGLFSGIWRGGAVLPERLLVDLDEDGQARVSSWPDGGLPEEVSLAPLEWPLDADALEDLRWYLEDYLLAPFGVWEERGPAVQAKLAGWGDQVFGSVFDAGPARDAYQRARDKGLEVVFRSVEPGLLGLPWELMRDGSWPVALAAGGISRSLPVAGGAGTLEVPGGQLRVLMVISRPAGTADVGYQMVARPLLERLVAVRGEVDLTVLRPPTFDALRQAVTEAADDGKPFHLVHFDGHGAMPGRVGSGGTVGGRPAMMTGPGEGVLAFEKPGGGSDHIGASKVAMALAEGKVPVVVLNACQSGAVGKELEASVATALLKAGCAAVVAMAYSVYAVAAAEFMAAFYESLFTGGSVGQAVSAGRRRLFEHDGRPSPKGNMSLADWLVPVHYMRREVRFPQARTARPAEVPSLDAALDQIRAAPSEPVAAQDPLAAVAGLFVGRDDLFYQLETAARLQRVVVLHGPGGTGKTELAKAFGRWWRDTGGVDRPDWVFWHSFEAGVASFGLNGVITEIGLRLYGADFARLHSPQRRAVIQNILAERRMLLIWDNFEIVQSMPDLGGASGPLDEASSAELREFLTHVAAHGNSAVLITSRTREDWLTGVRRIPLGGLAKHEAIEYAGHLLAPYPSATPRRARRAFGELMEWLDGHPLSMRLILPQLDTEDPEALLAALHGATPLPAADAVGEDRTTSLSASVSYSFAHLSESTRRLLPAVSLFHTVADSDVLNIFSQDAPEVPERFRGATGDDWSEALDDAARVGLLTRLGSGMYGILPPLPGYLSSWWRTEEPDNHEGVREAATKALVYAHAAFGDWLKQQITSGNAGLAHLVIELEHRTMSNMLGYALDYEFWREAQFIAQPLNNRWDARGLYEEARAWVDRVRLATEDADGNPPRPDTSAGDLWAYFVASQANRERGGRHFDAAERTYRQLLAMRQAQSPSPEQQRHIATIYHNLGVITQDRGRLEEAEDWYRRSLAILEALDDKPGLASAYLQLGKLAQDRWDFAQDRGALEEAERWYRRSLALDEELRNKPRLAVTYHQLGEIARFRERPDEAEGWYLRSMFIEEQLGNKPGLAESYGAVGGLVMSQGRLEEAEDWYRRSLTVSEEIGDKRGIAHTYRMVGMVAQQRGRLEEAEEWYRSSLAIGQEVGDKPSMARTLIQLAILAEHRDRLRLALEWTVRCVALFSDFPHPATGPAPVYLAQLTAQLGIDALEQSWQQITGESLPEAIRRSVEAPQAKGRNAP
jgi:tetratricopeptide (TPR) repeat protein/tRNA A37 threonylcarbamoyladenosine biosynthesis protein TsaE